MSKKFIEEALCCFPSKGYDYSYVDYKNCDTIVKIKCPIHGLFERVPYNFLKRKLGCPMCIKDKKALDEQDIKNKNFIIEAIKVHGEKYDYSKIKYINCKTKVIIKCKVMDHSEFMQIPASHISGAGCPTCGIERSAALKLKDKEWFISKAIKKHGDKYDYTDTNYTKSQDYVIIMCKKVTHIAFTQKANNHLQGDGCPQCAKEEASIRQRRTKEELVKQSILIHNDLYNYDMVIYISNHIHISIKCNKCLKIFEQTPANHLRGNGCPDCAIHKRAIVQTFTKDTFIKRANIIHSNKYMYDNTIYINSQTKIIISCSIHGDFIQIPNSHLQGYGCNQCAIDKNSFAQRFTNEQFIEKCLEIEGNSKKYDYTQTKYITMGKKITIFCKLCSKLFDQYANNHLNKEYGCNACCNNSKISKPQKQWLRFLEISNPSIEHGLKSGGEHRIKNSRYYADGYISINNTIAEFQGCFWHGCTKCYPRDAINPRTKSTFEDLYNKRIIKKDHCIANGYKYIELWECDWKNAISYLRKIQKYWRSTRKILLTLSTTSLSPVLTHTD